MASRSVTVRLPEDLAGWASGQGATSDVVRAALLLYREHLEGSDSSAPQKTGLVRGGKAVHVVEAPVGAHGEACQCIGCRAQRSGG